LGTLAGVLEFTTVGGETFTIHPGEVLLAEDNVGSGHKWRLINDEPWKRAYVVFQKGADTQFVPDSKLPACVRTNQAGVSIQISSSSPEEPQTGAPAALSAIS
jgi:hypothetical protein